MNQRLEIKLIYISTKEHKWELRTYVDDKCQVITVHDQHLWPSILFHRRIVKFTEANDNMFDHLIFYRRYITKYVLATPEVSEAFQSDILRDYLLDQILIMTDIELECKYEKIKMTPPIPAI